ncbi:SAVED domain-containing protein [Parendozoicomonas haliclonae]|nr:SAVED domain-containing protein [Parendozoicomonas haliclonae]
MFLTFLRFRRTSYPRTLWGAKLCTLALAGTTFSLGIFKVNFPSGYFIDSLELTAQQASLYSVFVSIGLAVVGALLIYSEWNMKTRHTAKVFISSLQGTSNDFPDEILDPTEKEFFREAVTLGMPQGYKEDIGQQVRRYNAELETDIFKRFILHDKGQRLYIGGLARIPFLVAYGAFLRNISSEVVYFDRFYKDGRWSLLNDSDEDVSFSETNPVTQVSEHGDIGLAIGFTTRITAEQLPVILQGHTTILSPNTDHGRNLIKNQENLARLSGEVSKLIDQMSALSGCKRIHLFLSVQSTLAIELGRRFQEGTHKNWIIHNFNPEKNSYDWSLELSRSGIEPWCQSSETTETETSKDMMP